MPINDESRNNLLIFVAHVAMLQSAVHRNATSEQIHARLSQIDADAVALAEVLAKEDPSLAEAVKQAWRDPARVGGRSSAGAQRS
jgi:cyanophycinase-like exopeptidase